MKFVEFCDQHCQATLHRTVRFCRRVHGDERGVVSLLTVFAIFMFTILLAMVINVGRHIDDKLRMQNAADAAAYSGGVVVARGMNAVAFTNHLEAEVFALTAYMREAQARDAEQLVPPILDAWDEIGGVFERYGEASGYTKFANLGRAIQQKVPLERELVTSYGEMAYRHSELTLPVLESILRGPVAEPDGPPDPLGGFIPRFQRAVVRSTPEMAQLAVDEISRRHGARTESQHRNLDLHVLLWRTDGQPLGWVDEQNPLQRTLPALDPSPTGVDGMSSGGPYFQTAVKQRHDLAHHYLDAWIRDWMGPYFAFDGDFRPGRSTAKMSQYINLFRVFACGQLDRLLDDEYPQTNLPHVIREIPDASAPNPLIEKNHTFVAVAYWPHLNETFPGAFRNLLSQDGRSDALTFSQVTVFVPWSRLRCCPWLVPQYDNWGEFRGYGVNQDNWPNEWTLLNQNWMVKLVPATSPSIVPIIQTQPPGVPGFRPPNLGSADMQDVRTINTH